MKHHASVNGQTPIPEGADFLRALQRISAKCEQLTDEYLHCELTKGSLTLHEHLGALLSLLDRASSCWWGCHGGDHAAEHLFGRCCSYAGSAFRLARSGAYDESLALTRTIWEITNLAVLFVTDPTILQDWRNTDERTRKDKYCPVNVRRGLENSQLGGSVLSREHYSFLCAKGVHLTPTMLPQMYNTSRQPMIGGWFQEVGLCLCLSEIGYAFAFLGLSAVITPNGLLKLDDKQGTKVGEASKALMRSLPQAWERVNASFPGTCPKPVGDPFGGSP
jgi:hypothetical protein